jgi:hypothetical protein
MVAQRVLDALAAHRGVSPWISTASNASSAGCAGGARRSSETVMCGSALTSVADEVVLRALHQRRHHDREADAGGDAGDATPVWRMRARTHGSRRSRG